MKIRISPGAVLLAGVMIFLLDASSLTALLLAIAVHELGHAAAILICGGRIYELRAEPTGFCMLTSPLGCGKCLITAAAGPAAGIIYAFFASKSADSTLILSAGISLIYSLFNLLPALPLDGGRMLEALLYSHLRADRAELALKSCTLFTAAGLICFGTGAMLRGYGPSPLIAGMLILYNE